MNGTLTFVFLIVLVVMIASVARSWIAQRKHNDRSGDDELAETLQKIEQLEERIKVLERIVTENRFDLKQQIDNL